MTKGYFINIAVDTAIKDYLNSKSNKDSIAFNSFLVVVIRMLTSIYNESDIINPYYLDNSVAFINNLGKYGKSKMDITSFLEELLAFYEFEEKNKNSKIKLKNPSFVKIQKYLTEMFILKKQNGSVSFDDEEEFLDLIYTSHTKNPYRLSYWYLKCDDPNFIEKYYYTLLNNGEVTRVDLDKTINANLNLEALNYLGIGLSNLKNMSNKEILDAKDNAYRYFEVDAESPTRDEDLKKAVDFYKIHGQKLTSGNGYVDILLLMSVIVTSLSIVAIIIFQII